MKQKIAILFSLILLMGALGCSKAGQPPAALDKQYIYSELDRLMGDTSLVPGTSLTMQIAFTAMLYSEVIDAKAGDKPYKYAFCAISRNQDDYFALNLSELKTLPAKLDRIQITGKITGTTAVSVGEWGDVMLLEVTADKCAVLGHDKKHDVEASSLFQLKKSDGAIEGNLLFLSADYSEDKGQIALYFVYENNSGESRNPPTGLISFFHNGDKLRPSKEIFNGQANIGANQDGSFLVKPGESAAFYITLDDSPNAIKDEPLSITLYDDDFNLTNSAEIDVSQPL